MWQTETIADVQRLFATNPYMKGLILVGSNASGEADLWSDVDFVCIIEDTAVNQFYPTTEWLTLLGHVFAVEQFISQDRRVTRVCFTDFRRADFIFIAENTLTTIDQWFYPRSQTRLLFSKSAIVSEALKSFPESEKVPPQFDDQQYEEMNNRFWFKAVMSVNKVMRNDLLIGLHLALDLSRDCLVLGMLFRDREAGTSVHRFGGPYNEIVDDLGLCNNEHSKVERILNIILQSAKTYDRLASQWSSAYRQSYPLFAEWVKAAKEKLP
ncbi:MAG: hypothetical protein GC179_09360 [Anaerolineaceae bacterium]|nr:hypothetical protein [Anaerolineaceae bacterium]